jgi:glutathione synthase
LQLSSQQREAVEHAAAILYADGIRLAGIDLIGTKVIEFNVFSTGGLYDASQFAGQDFAKRIIDRLVIADGSRNLRR